MAKKKAKLEKIDQDFADALAKVCQDSIESDEEVDDSARMTLR